MKHQYTPPMQSLFDVPAGAFARVNAEGTELRWVTPDPNGEFIDHGPVDAKKRTEWLLAMEES